MERAVGKLHDIDGQEDDEAEFKDAGETSKETVDPAQVDCMKQFGEERTEDRQDDGNRQKNKDICHNIAHFGFPRKLLKQPR